MHVRKLRSPLLAVVVGLLCLVVAVETGDAQAQGKGKGKGAGKGKELPKVGEVTERRGRCIVAQVPEPVQHDARPGSAAKGADHSMTARSTVDVGRLR